jgi:hypothetical protein
MQPPVSSLRNHRKRARSSEAAAPREIEIENSRQKARVIPISKALIFARIIGEIAHRLLGSFSNAHFDCLATVLGSNLFGVRR